MNVRSILPKLDILRVDLNNINFDVLSISESWLKPNIDDCLLGLKNLKFVRLDRSIVNDNGNLKNGGGLICYFKADFVGSIIRDITFCTIDLEVLSLLLRKENHLDIVVISIYRPPSGSLTTALDLIKDIWNKVCDNKNNRDVYVVGDLNLNLLVNSHFSKTFAEICSQFSLYSLVNIPSRITRSTSTLIDLIVTSCTKIVSSGVIEYNISDHLILYSVKKHIKHKVSRIKTRARNFENYDLDLIKENLVSYNWGRFYAKNDVDDVWDELYCQILATADNFSPYRDTMVRATQPGWLTNELIESSIERDRLLAKAKKSSDVSVITKAKEKRNELKTSIKNARSNFYIDTLKRHSGDPKKFWKKINDLIKGKSTTHVTNVVDPNTGVLTDQYTSANIINKFFTEIGHQLDLKLPLGTDPKSMYKVNTVFELKPDITVDTVSELISGIDISKSSGCLLISSRIYKDCLAILCEQLAFFSIYR